MLQLVQKKKKIHRIVLRLGIVFYLFHFNAILIHFHAVSSSPHLSFILEGNLWESWVIVGIKRKEWECTTRSYKMIGPSMTLSDVVAV